MITIYQKSIIEAEMDGVVNPHVEASQDAIDKHIDTYTDHIANILESAGYLVEVRYNDKNAKCYYTDTDEEHEEVRELPSFWEWYN